MFSKTKITPELSNLHLRTKIKERWVGYLEFGYYLEYLQLQLESLAVATMRLWTSCRSRQTEVTTVAGLTVASSVKSNWGAIVFMIAICVPVFYNFHNLFPYHGFNGDNKDFPEGHLLEYYATWGWAIEYIGRFIVPLFSLSASFLIADYYQNLLKSAKVSFIDFTPLIIFNMVYQTMLIVQLVFWPNGENLQWFIELPIVGAVTMFIDQVRRVYPTSMNYSGPRQEGR